MHDRVLDTACNLFYRQGYRATGINQVIKESGVAKASFYDHFPSKDDLLVEYVQEMSRRETVDLEAQVMSLPSVEERFFGPLKILPPWFEESAFRGCPFQNAIAELPEDDTRVHAAIRRHREAEREFFREITRAYVEASPSLKGIDIDALADTYMLLFEGAIALTASVRDIWPVARAREALEAYLRS